MNETITRDVLCYGCGYNLRTRSIHGECSECGTPVSESLGPVVIEPDDAAAVKRWRVGIKMLSVNAALTAGISLLTMFSLVVLSRREMGVIAWICSVAVTAAEVLWVAGVICSTRRPADPGSSPVDTSGSARFYAVLAAVTTSLFVAFGLRGFVIYPRTPLPLELALWLLPFACLLMLASIHTLLDCQRAILIGLGQRRRTRDLIRWVRLIRFGLIAFVAGYGICWLAIVDFPDDWPSSALWFALILWLGSGIWLIVMAGVAAVKLWKLSRITL